MSVPTSIFLALPGPSNDIIISSRTGEAELPGAEPAIVKFWFGVGDGISGSAELQHVPYGTRRATPVIRGWKYGLMSAIPLNSSCVFRRNRFGQYRDMLEQRLQTRFFTGEDDRTVSAVTYKGVTAPAVYVRFVDSETGDTTTPINTHSQNLSTYATSSVPYFEDQVRDREDNPDVNEDFTITM